MPEDRIDHQPWPARAVILLVLGIILAMLFDGLLPDSSNWSIMPFHIAPATFVAVGGLAFAYTLERLRWHWSVLFGLGCGLVAGGITYWSGGPEDLRFASLLLAIAIAAPLFQVMRDEGRWRVAQQPFHAHVWSNLILWGVSWLFVLIAWLLANLMAELFALTGLDFLKDLLREDMFNWALVGGSLGAAIGLLRDRDQVLGVMQRVATVVLSFLTPVIALGLGFFLLSLLFTGLGPLWETNQTTPILLICAFVAFFFANATIGNSVEEEPRNSILRYGAIVLAIVIAPLAAIAAVSTGLRIDQHGFTPERLWAATCILVALVFGLAYWASLARGRTAWPDRVRASNAWLALALCGLAVLLATPIISFGVISTRDQLARLNSGEVTPDQFDWRALAFDFGPSGRKALEQLKRAGASETIRTAAAQALNYQDRWSAPDPGEQSERRARIAQARVLPKPVPLPPDLKRLAEEHANCSNGSCTILYEVGRDQALLISRPLCISGSFEKCEIETQLFRRTGERWWHQGHSESYAPTDAQGLRRVRQGWARGEIEIREVTRRQVFVGGEPLGDVID